MRALCANASNVVVVADNLLTGRVERIPRGLPNVRFAKCDVNELAEVERLFADHRFDYVFHFAAVVGVQRTLAHPMWVLRDGIGIENVLNCSAIAGVRRVYYSSSSEVYGEAAECPQHEQTTPLNSRLPYAVIKNLGETTLRAYHREYGLGYLIFRFFNTYGPDQSEDFVVPRFVLRALRGDDITIHGDGRQSRTFCHVDDNVAACVRALESGVDAETINVGSDEQVSVLELAERVISLTGSKSRVVFGPPLPEGDMRSRQPDISKMRRLLGRGPATLDEGLQRLVAHYVREGLVRPARIA